MTKFLNESGFRRIIKTIKNALSLKADKSELPLIVLSDGRQCDTSIADIYAAFLAGRDVEMNIGYLYKLSLVQCSEEVAIFSTNFSDQSIGIKGTISNGVDTWEFIVVDLQQRLTSGTNIKTVNSQTLLGSGDILLNAATIGTSPSGNYDGNPIEEVLDEKQDSLVSGTNIKTINNTSLLGSGNISIEPNEIASITTTESTASGGNNTVTITETDGTTTTFNVKNGVDGADGVSLGEISLVQTTGDSEESVMSQKAVTEYGRKVTAEDLAGTSDWIKAKLTALGWEFGKYVGSSGNTATNASYCASAFIPVSNIKEHSITIGYMYNAWATSCFCFYDSSKTFISGAYYGSNVDNLRTVNIPTSSSWDNVAYLRFTCNSDRLSECYIYDNTDEVYIWKGDEYLGTIYEDNLVSYKTFRDVLVSQESGKSTLLTMSQKAICEKFDTVVYESKRPSYFKGTFSKFNIADFPLFDPRDSDGISVLIEWDKKSGNRVSLFEMMTANQNNNQQFFALAYQWGNIETGLISNYFVNVDMGCTGTTPANYNHLVITLDFKKGITKIYLNGVLYNTIQASNYSYETLMTYLNTCTKIGLGGSSSNAETKTQGLAVFGHVLTDDDVTTLFGGGCEELKTELIPEKWEANSLKPHYFNCGIGTYNGQVNAGKAGGTIVGDTITINSDCVVLYLALTGIDGSELYGNCIYDFDFEVLSGTGTTYDRGMQYAGNYWKCFTMTDEDGNDVSYNTQIGVGRYHVTSRPDNIRVGGYNGGLNLGYIFVNCSSDFSIKLYSPARLIERGAAIICTPKTYKGLYWQQRNGYKIPTSGYVYDSSTNTIPYYDLYKSSTVKYASNVPPQFNGQMAVDSTNGKVYVGYLTGTGGTWKQINNS